MNKLLKWVLAGVGVVVVLLVIATVVLPMVVDPNNYKEEIRASVLEETGRELTIGGEIKWTVFPSIGLDLSDLKLGNRSGFGDQPMLSVGAASVSVKLIPLFSRNIEIGQVSLTDVSANLRRKANGQNNWEDLSSSQSGTATTSTSGGGDLDAFVVSGVEVRNANVTWDDAGQIIELKGFSLKASHIELGRPFNLEGGFSLNLAQSELSGEVIFSGLVQSEANGARYGIEGLDISFKGKQGAAGESVPLDVAVKANADVDLTNNQATLSDFALRFHDLMVNGELDVTSLSSDPQFEGQLKLADFNPKSFLKALGVEAPQTTDANALTSLQAEMSFAGSSSSANMQNLSVKFDKSTFKGNLKVENFDSPQLAFDFQIDRLNLDEYLPESEAETDANTKGPDLTVDVFRGYFGGGNVRIGELVVAGLTATDVSLTISSDGKGIRLFPISAQFYGGLHKGDIRIDASGNRPILITSQELTGVQAEGLLQDLTGSARLQGTGDVSLKVRTDLTNSQSGRQALSGDMGISFLDGAIVGFNVAETIRTAKNVLGKQSKVAGETGRNPKTDFSELTMTGVFEQGVMSSDDLMMKSPLLRVTGKGTANLVEETIDYLLKPILVGDLEGQGGLALVELSGIPIPVRLTGNLYEPDISVNIAAAIAGSQKAMINEKKDALIGQLLGDKDDSDTANQADDANEKADPAKSLLDGIFGSKKGKKKKEDDGGVY
jgi:AsmA protein